MNLCFMFFIFHFIFQLRVYYKCFCNNDLSLWNSIYIIQLALLFILLIWCEQGIETTYLLYVEDIYCWEYQGNLLKCIFFCSNFMHCTFTGYVLACLLSTPTLFCYFSQRSLILCTKLKHHRRRGTKTGTSRLGHDILLNVSLPVVTFFITYFIQSIQFYQVYMINYTNVKALLAQIRNALCLNLQLTVEFACSLCGFPPVLFFLPQSKNMHIGSTGIV